VLRAEWIEHGDLLEFWIEADAFMRNMNRILVGTMLEVATGRRGADDFARLLHGADRRQAGATAPPHGLYFATVSYPQSS
jgi:tRNA pseudouridine38-40 synthase